MTKAQQRLMALAFGVMGLGLFWYATNGLAALGLFLATWGNNIAHSKHAP